MNFGCQIVVFFDHITATSSSGHFVRLNLIHLNHYLKGKTSWGRGYTVTATVLSAAVRTTLLLIELRYLPFHSALV